MICYAYVIYKLLAFTHEGMTYQSKNVNRSLLYKEQYARYVIFVNDKTAINRDKIHEIQLR